MSTYAKMVVHNRSVVGNIAFGSAPSILEVEENVSLEFIVSWIGSARRGKLIDHLIFVCHGSPGLALLGRYGLGVSDVKKFAPLRGCFTKAGFMDFRSCALAASDKGMQLCSSLAVTCQCFVRASRVTEYYVTLWDINPEMRWDSTPIVFDPLGNHHGAEVKLPKSMGGP